MDGSRRADGQDGDEIAVGDNDDHSADGGNDSNDLLSGASGDARLYKCDGTDSMTGGAGSETVVF